MSWRDLTVLTAAFDYYKKSTSFLALRFTFVTVSFVILCMAVKYYNVSILVH